MKRLIYNKDTKEIDIIEKDDFLEKKKKRKVRSWLENNKIFFEIFSFVFVGFMGIVISFIGLKFNKSIVDINKRQLEITENDKKPHFYIESDYISATIDKAGVDGKKPKCYYNIINKGEDITEVLIEPESYIFFYIPTDVDGEYYIFQFNSHDFYKDYVSGIETIEKDKEYRFAEYIIKEGEKSEWMEIAKRVFTYFPNIKCVHKNIAKISYVDYMGEKQEEFFVFNDRDIKKEHNEENYVLLKDDYGIDFNTPKPALQSVENSAEDIIKGIDDWMKKNNGSRGYKIPKGTRFEYIS